MLAAAFLGDALYQVIEGPSIPIWLTGFFFFFYHEWVLDLSNTSFASIDLIVVSSFLPIG